MLSKSKNLVKPPARKSRKNEDKQHKDDIRLKRKDKERERLADIYLSLMDIKWEK